MNEYATIVKRGGRVLAEANRECSRWLDSIESELSETAVDVIADTDYNALYECFGMCETAEEINNYVQEFYSEY